MCCYKSELFIFSVHMCVCASASVCVWVFACALPAVQTKGGHKTATVLIIYDKRKK